MFIFIYFQFQNDNCRLGTNNLLYEQICILATKKLRYNSISFTKFESRTLHLASFILRSR